MVKIAIASDDGNTISSHFGRSKGFIIFDIEDNKITGKDYRINNFTGHARGLHDSSQGQHGHGMILQALKDCKAVLAMGMGRRIYNDLQNAGIEAFIVDQTNAEMAIDLYLKNDLKSDPQKGCDHGYSENK